MKKKTIRSVHMSKALRDQHAKARRALERAGKLAFKPESSAKWIDISRSWKGNILVQIEHDNIKNCTPEMLCWWFHNMGGTTTWNGEDFSGPEIPLYHLWHHRDHIAVTPLSHGADGQINRGFLAGADSRIEERFNEVHFHVKTRMHTTVLNNEEFTFEILIGGLPVGHITHRYAAQDKDCTFYAETEIGSRIPVVGWLFNWLVLPFIYNKKTAEHWVKHNIEETGRTEDFLPILYAARQNMNSEE